jgi:hypothetical protein
MKTLVYVIALISMLTDSTTPTHLRQLTCITLSTCRIMTQMNIVKRKIQIYHVWNMHIQSVLYVTTMILHHIVTWWAYEQLTCTLSVLSDCEASSTSRALGWKIHTVCRVTTQAAYVCNKHLSYLNYTNQWSYRSFIHRAFRVTHNPKNEKNIQYPASILKCYITALNMVMILLDMGTVFGYENEWECNVV